MIAVLQRVTKASVAVEEKTVGQCGKGLMILLGVAKGDTDADAAVLSTKIAKLRIFCDDNDKMNLSLLDIDGEALVISNFSLLANYQHGNRPDYLSAEAPEEANRLYEEFCDLLSAALGKPVATGIFGADMEVEISNHGPITIVMDSKILMTEKRKA